MKTLSIKTTKTKNMLVTGLVATLLSSSFVLTGCGGTTREQTGTIMGSVVGGVVGHQMGKGRGNTAMTIVGAVAGGLIGGSIARGMDRRDQQKINQSLDTAPNYEKVAWENEQTQQKYTFTPVNQYEGEVNGNRTQCRDYIMDAWIDGRMQQVKGRACKDPSGQWVNAS